MRTICLEYKHIDLRCQELTNIKHTTRVLLFSLSEGIIKSLSCHLKNTNNIVWLDRYSTSNSTYMSIFIAISICVPIKLIANFTHC